jgi:uncharacterized protein
MIESIVSPMVLAFALGLIAARLKSDLKFPDSLYTSLTIYLMVAIGMKGGYKLSITPFSDVLMPAAAALLISSMIPVWTYFIMRKLGRFDNFNAAALAAHYGSVSAVTFSAALAFHDSINMQYEGYMPSLLAIMEIPAILIAIALSRVAQGKNDVASAIPMKEIFKELLVGKGSILLIGFLLIGYFSGASGWKQVSPLFDAPFKGVLTLFLLEAGLVAGRKLKESRSGGYFLVGFGLLMPIAHAVLGIFLGKLAGLSEGGATILGVLSASASYIAAPAACRVALPEANPGYYLSAALAITFPFNITVGLQLYHYFAHIIYSN